MNFSSENNYYHFQTGRVATARFQSVRLFRYINLFFSYLYFPVYLFWLRPDVIEINSSLVSGSFRRDYWYAKIASLMMPNSKLVLFNHGWNAEDKKKIEAGSKEKIIKYFNFFDCIVVLAERFRYELYIMGIATPVKVITTAINLTDFEGLPDKRCSSQKRLLFLSRIEKEKGVDELLDAVPALVTRYPNLEICIAGKGEYERIAYNHPSVSKFNKNVRFVGYIRGDEKMELLAGADVFVFPSSYGEGCPVSVLEAIAVGLPLIYTPVGALPDLLENGRNGIQVQPGSSKQVESAVLRLLGNPDLMNSMSENNIMLSKQFDIRVIHRKLEEIYEAHD